MREWTKGIVKKITLEVVYDIVDERTRDIYRKLEKIEERQESDFKYLNQKINQLNQKVDIQIGLLRQEMNGINQRIDVLVQMVANLQK